jgi:hypothetical protein
MGWVRNVVCMGMEISACKISVGKPEERRQLRKLHVGGVIILKWILKK